MSETRFTPGPWTVGKGTGFLNQVAINPSIGCAYGAGDEFKANARLISCAPDLYATVEKQDVVIDLLLAMLIAKDPDFMPSESKVGQMLMEIDAPRLLARARGE